MCLAWLGPILIGTAMPAGAGAGAVTPLIVNGGFEQGLSGWETFSQVAATSYDDNTTPPAGAFAIQEGSGLTPLSGLETLGPNSGSRYALADATAPGVRILLQRFTTPGTLISAELSFALFTYDWSGFGPEGSDFDIETAPNQHIQVDLLTGDADPFATDATSVVASLFNGLPPNPTGFDPPEWQTYTFDLSPFLVAGQSYQLRFAAVDNLFVLNMGVDDVSIRAVIPEPTSLALLAPGLLLVLAARRLGMSRASG